MAGMIAVFAEFERDILRARVKAGIAHAREKGKPHGRPQTTSLKNEEIKKLSKNGLNNQKFLEDLKSAESR